MLKRILVVLLMVALAALFFPLMTAVEDATTVGQVASHYLEQGPGELGAANLVTAVVVTYRGLDTLGEVTVLFAAAAGVAVVIGQGRRAGSAAPGRHAPGAPDSAAATATTVPTTSSGAAPPPRADATVAPPADAKAPSEILSTAAGILFPIVLLFGVYIFVHGHLTPGGGFQGGVVIASAVLLAFLANSIQELRHGVLATLETIAGAGYVAIGFLGLWLAGGFLDPRFLPSGELGSLLSAGAIPVIYSLVGIKVGTELSGVIDTLRGRA